MLAFNVCWRVFVAAVAGVLGVGRGVARLASHLTLIAMVEREAMILQLRRNPGARCVARFAFRPEQPGMNLRFGMAQHTFFRRAFELVVDVALHTFCRGVFAV